ELPKGGKCRFDTGPDEVLVVPLAGGVRVLADETFIELTGRPDPFAGPTDFAYVPRDTAATLESLDGGRFALASARARARWPARHAPAEDVPIELRGAGAASREVRNLATPDVFAADALISCEVITPGGNWSSYPPHKHDEAGPAETALEEIYYYEIADGPGGPGLAYQRVAASPAGPIDVLAEVRTGDVVLVPHGWHGPTMAAPGYDLYYLNVMAGPGSKRAWQVTDDPAHAWIRSTWPEQPFDPRLTSSTGKGRTR
ncbi:MAG: 5-deoxy-glucuronate isomerase, partial [Chloroflexi bacterium]|nr:5-deoxy-glucuronate isomerase [Chloroflexota bacterium]